MPLTVSQLLSAALSDKRKNIEPAPRKFAGAGMTHVAHRFPIKGGISWVEMLSRAICANNAVLWELTKWRRIDSLSIERWEGEGGR